MTEPPVESGILTLLEAARRDPPLHDLRFSNATIDAITVQFDIPASKRGILHECLEGAALVYERQLRGSEQAPDVAPAEGYLIRICEHLEELVALTEPIEMFAPDGLHIGKKDRFKHLGMPEALAFATGLQFLIAPFVKRTSSGWFTTDGQSISALREWRQENLQAVNSITAILRKIIGQPAPKRRRADNLLPLKMLALCLAHFWTDDVERDIAITRATVETNNANEKATINVSLFADFCVMCFRVLDDCEEPNLRTPIEAARAHILKEREIRQACADRDYERVSRLQHEWKDRIPLSIPI